MSVPEPLPFPPRRRGPGRPRLEAEAGAVWRVLAERAFVLRWRQPRRSWASIARRLHLDDGTLSRYRRRYVEVYGDPYDGVADLLRIGERKETVR